MGLPYHGAAQFLDTHPILRALVVGLFPGVFEETGRLVAYKTVLRKRKNCETSISHGIGTLTASQAGYLFLSDPSCYSTVDLLFLQI